MQPGLYPEIWQRQQSNYPKTQPSDENLVHFIRCNMQEGQAYFSGQRDLFIHRFLRKVCILKIQVRLSMIGLLWPKEIISFLDLELKLIINKICVATRTPADVDWPGKQKHHVMNAFGRKHVWHSRWLNHLQLNIAERRA